MIKPQDKVFANLRAHLHHDLPLAPLIRIVNLAAVAWGVLRSKSLQVGQIVTALPLEGTRDSLKNGEFGDVPDKCTRTHARTNLGKARPALPELSCP